MEQTRTIRVGLASIDDNVLVERVTFDDVCDARKMMDELVSPVTVSLPNSVLSPKS